MANAIIVADYVIDESIQLKKTMPNAKLQKVLFFLDVAHLVEYNTHLITDFKFEKWSYGPTIKAIQKLYGDTYGSSKITKVLKYRYLVKTNNYYEIKIYTYHKENLAQDDRDFIDKYLNSLLNYNMWDLIKLSQQDPQWIRRNFKDPNDCYYDLETIDYYNNHKIWYEN